VQKSICALRRRQGSFLLAPRAGASGGARHRRGGSRGCSRKAWPHWQPRQHIFRFACDVAEQKFGPGSPAPRSNSRSAGLTRSSHARNRSVRAAVEAITPTTGIACVAVISQGRFFLCTRLPWPLMPKWRRRPPSSISLRFQVARLDAAAQGYGTPGGPRISPATAVELLPLGIRVKRRRARPVDTAMAEAGTLRNPPPTITTPFRSPLTASNNWRRLCSFSVSDRASYITLQTPSPSMAAFGGHRHRLPTLRGERAVTVNGSSLYYPHPGSLPAHRTLLLKRG